MGSFKARLIIGSDFQSCALVTITGKHVAKNNELYFVAKFQV